MGGLGKGGGNWGVLYMINSLPIRAICHREAMSHPGGYNYDLVISFRYCRELWAALAWASSTVGPVPWHTATGIEDSCMRHWCMPEIKTRSSVNVSCLQSDRLM